MIEKKLRFHGHGSLKYVYKHAATYRSRYVVIRAISNPRRKHARFGVVVSKKIHKSAVGRNRIRRRIYEVLRHELPMMQKNMDIVVIVTNGEVLMAESADIKKSLIDLLRQTDVYDQ